MAAHFLHAGNVAGVAVSLFAPALFLVGDRWNLLVLQGLAYLAAAIWLITAWQLVELRWSLGRPWHLAAAILIAVAIVTAAAGRLLSGMAARPVYRDR